MTGTVVVVSGGLDSAVLAYKARKQHEGPLHLLSFDYGQRHKRELECAAKIAKALDAKHDIINLTDLRALLKGSSLTDDAIDTPHGHYAAESMKLTVVPGRNAIMLSIAWGVAVSEGADRVGIGVHSGDHFIYPDCRPEFIYAMRNALAAGTADMSGYTKEIWTPFLSLTKADIVVEGAIHGVPFEDTWTCYEGGDVHCGKCGSCVERREAFAEAGVADPTEYAS
jgi:7-cyano-7-deazaguanine synthase